MKRCRRSSSKGTPKKSPGEITYSLLVASFVTIAGLVGTPAGAQDKTDEIDRIFSWATSSTPGCAVAVSLHGKRVVSRAYGLADLERDVLITPKTVFDAGSLQKQFVAAAALVLVEDGTVSLTEDIRKYLPDLPDFGHKISIDHLLTHTSGLRDWTGIQRLTAEKADALTLILRQRGLNFAPGEEWSYSNSGYVLMKEIIARTSGMTFGEFTQERLLKPLGMKSTVYVHDLHAEIRNRALAYEKDGSRWKKAMLLDDNRGGGALFSTAEDLVTWNEAMAHRRLGAFVSEKIHEPAKLNNGRELSYARGLLVDENRGGRFYWHGGSAHGYKSLLTRFPEQRLSIAILCNSGDATVRTESARRIFDLFVPAADGQTDDARHPLTPAEDVDVTGGSLGNREGLFVNDDSGEFLELVVRRGKLRIAGGPALVATSNNRFRCRRASLRFMSQDEFEIRFLTEDILELRSMEGKTTRYRRARTPESTANGMEALAGQYESDEIGTVFRIQPDGDGLNVRLEHLPTKSLNFKPVDRDIFRWRRMTLRFHRDSHGKVVGLAYSNPVLRNVRFTHVVDSQP